MNRRFLALLAPLALLSTAAAADEWAPVESTRWIALPDAGSASTLELQTLDGRALRGVWRAIEPGDTLSFAVRGTGTLRVETRATVASGASGAEYRIGVRTAPGTVRALLRRSPGAQEVRSNGAGGSIRRMRLAEVDRWETSLVAGSERVDVFLREGQSGTVLVRVLARGAVERPARAREHETRVEWDLLAGYAGAGLNTNAYLAPSDSIAAETAFFWPAEFDVAVQIDPGGRFDYGFGYDFSGTFHADDILNVYRHQAEAWQRWRDLAFSRFREVELRFREVFRTKNRTYFGRGYSEEIETASGYPPGQDSPLSDRYDWREGRLLADLQFGPRTGVSTELSGGYIRRDYVHDYQDDPDTYSLDHDEFVASARVQWRGESDFWVRLDAGIEDRRYDEKFARDVQGAEVRSVATHLTYLPVELGFGRRPPTGWRWKAGFGAERVLDRYLGYWDRTNWGGGVDLDRVMRGGHRVGFRLDRSITDYDRSRVGNVPDGPIREKDVWIVGADLDYLLGDSWRVNAMVEFKDRNNNSPNFDYSDVESMVGLSYAF